MSTAFDSIQRVPLHCFWEITEACNLRCIHCELDAGSRVPGELSTEEALVFCDDLAKAGCKHVVLTGGEPLVRADWPIIAERIASLGMTPTIITNGMAVDENTVSLMARAGIQSASVSIDGNEAIHDAIRVGPNQTNVFSYRHAVSALKLLSSSGFKTAAITQVHKGNLNDLPKMYDEMVELKVDTWQVQICMPLGRLMRFNREYLLEPKDVLTLIAYLKELIPRRRLKIAVADNIGYFTKEEPVLRGASRERHGFWTGCKAGCLVVAVCSNGDIKGCPSHPTSFVVGNIKRTPFAEIWQNESNFSYKTCFQENLLEGKCATCEFRHLCKAGCTTMAFSVTGTIYNNPFCALQMEENPRGTKR